jgi:hypothetical protein
MGNKEVRRPSFSSTYVIIYYLKYIDLDADFIVLIN